MNEPRVGQVVYLRVENENYFLEEYPHIVTHIDMRYANHIYYETESFDGLASNKQLEIDEIQVAENQMLPQEYEEIKRKKYVDLSSLTQVDIYEATDIQIMTGKEYVETCYDEWSDYFSGEEDFSEYIGSMGTPLNDIKLDGVYAGDIVEGYAQEIHSVNELNELIEHHMNAGYKEGDASEYRNSEEYFQELAELIGYDSDNLLKQPIIKVDGHSMNDGYYTEKRAVTELEQIQKYLKIYDKTISETKFIVYEKRNVHEPSFEVDGSEYLEQYRQKELEQTPYFKEQNQAGMPFGNGSYYHGLLENYHERHPDTTDILEGQSFNGDEVTTILNTGKYSYEYDHAVNNVDKIDNDQGVIVKSYDADRSPESKKQIEKEIATEIKNEPIRIKKREERIKQQKLDYLKRKGLER